MALTFGSEYAFNSAATHYNRIAKLDSTHFVTIYTDVGNSNYGTAIIGTLSDNTISYGSESVYYSGTCYYHDVAMLDSTHFVVVYQNASDTKLYSRIGVVSSGTTITWGAVSAAMSSASCGYYLRVAASSSTQFSVQFQDANNAYYATIRKGTVSGNAITVVGGAIALNASTGTTLAQIAVSADNYINFYNTGGSYGYARYNTGTAQAFYTGSVTHASAVLLDSTHFAVAYRKPTSTYTGFVKIGTISGTSISFGTEYTFNSVNTDQLSISAFDSTHIVISYQNTGASSYGTVVMATVSGSTITFNEREIFNSAVTEQTAIVAMDATKFIVSYRDAGNSDYGTAIAGAFVNNNITYGSKYIFNNANTAYQSVALIDSTHFVAVYQDTGNSSYGTAVIGTVSEDTVSYGSEYVFNNASTGYTSVALIDSTHFVVVYQDSGNSSYGTAVIGTISGSTISFGSEYVFYGALTGYPSVALLDSTHFIVAYTKAAGLTRGNTIIGTISDSTISFGSEYSFNSGMANYTSVALIDSTHFVVSYVDAGNSSKGTAVIGTISDGVISYGSKYVFNNASTSYTTVALIDSTHFAVAYQDTGNSSKGTAVIGTVSGTTISYGSEYVFNNASTAYPSVALLDSTHFTVSYQNTGNSSYGTSVIGTISGSTISFSSENVFNNATTTYELVLKLDSTHFLVAYTASTTGNSVIGTIPASSVTHELVSSMSANATVVSELFIPITHELTCSISTSVTVVSELWTPITHELDLDIETHGSVATTLYKEIGIEALVSAGSSLGLVLQKEFHLESGIQPSASVELEIQKQSDLDCDIAEVASVSGAITKTIGLDVDIETHGSTTAGLEQQAVKILGLNIGSQLQVFADGIIVAKPTLVNTDVYGSNIYRGISATNLTSNLIVVISRNNSTYYYGAKVATISNGEIAYSSNVYNISDSYNYHSCMSHEIDSERFLVAYTNVDTYKLRLKIGSVSGETITYGNTLEINTKDYSNTLNEGWYISSIKKIATNKLIITVDTYTPRNTATIVVTISGDTITCGNPIWMPNGYDNVILASSTLDTSHFAIIGADSSGILKLNVPSVTDAVVYYQESATTVFSDATVASSICGVNSPSSSYLWFAVAYGNKIKIGSHTISNGANSFGSEYSFSANTVGSVKIAKKGSNLIFISYLDASDSYKEKVCVAKYNSSKGIEFSSTLTLSNSTYVPNAIFENLTLDSYYSCVFKNEFSSPNTYLYATTYYYGNLVPLYLTIAERVAISSLANQTIGLRLNSNPYASLNISGGMEKNLSTSISAVAESGYELYRALGLTAQIEARAYVTPFVQRVRDLQLAMEAALSATNGLDAIKALQVLIEKVSSATAYGQLSKNLQSAMDAVSEIAARAEVNIGLESDIVSTASASLSILRLCDLVDAMAANGSVSSDLSLDVILSSVFNPHSELWAKAYIELAGSCVIEEHPNFALTMEHVATLVSLIQGSSSAEANPELTHMLASFVDAKATMFATFKAQIEAIMAINQTSTMTADAMIYHIIDLICSLDPEASLFFTSGKIMQLTAQINANAEWTAVLMNLLRAYLEFKGSIDKEIALSGILANKIIYTGKLGDKIIYFNGSIL